MLEVFGFFRVFRVFRGSKCLEIFGKVLIDFQAPSTKDTLHSQLFILNSSFFILHSQFFILHSITRPPATGLRQLE